MCFRLLVLPALFAAAVALAADPPKSEPKPKEDKNKAKLTYTNPAETDEDFPIQGEYVGLIAWPQFGRDEAGLQVIALGGGKFDAVLYRGGLPGEGWIRPQREQLSGERKPFGVQLVGWLGSIVIENGRAQFYNAKGMPAGTLSRKNRVSPTIGATPPPGAIVLFDEHTKNLDQFSGAKLTKEGYLHSGLLTKMKVGDFRLHLEFRTPYMPYARGQARANSGVYIQQRYELQILDSFGLKGEFNECGALYRQQPPEFNMAYPPLAWQTYDLYFTAAKFAADGKTKTAPARLTAYHNGTAVHFERLIKTKTGAGKAEGPEEFPINLQDHGNPVAFRNVWIVPMNSAANPRPSVSPSIRYVGACAGCCGACNVVTCCGAPCN